MSDAPAAGRQTAVAGGPGAGSLGSELATPATRQDAQQSAKDAPPDAAPPRRHVARRGRHYEHGPNLFSPAFFQRYRRTAEDPLYRPLRVFLTDPVKSSYAGGVTTVVVPYETLEAGPAGSFLAVSDGDTFRARPVGKADLDSRAATLSQGFRPSTADPAFHQQMVYAVCAEVAAVFMSALGRDLSWGFDGGVLKLRPHFAEERNAYYDARSRELRFGYFAAERAPGGEVLPGGTVFTCLSHDVVAHEMTHAVLDGLRSRFHEPTNPDVLAFHEAFADLVAILLHFTHVDAVEAAIARSTGSLGTDRTIFSLAAEVGAATGLGGPLRVLLGTIEADRARYGNSEEPHARGMVLVSAVLDALSRVFERRAAPIKSLVAASAHGSGGLPPAALTMLAKLASRTAAQFLALCIRAIDYCPPVDIRFGEYLRALVTADRDLVEDDRDGFRQELIGAFARRAIFPDDVPDISEDALLWDRPCAPPGALAIPELAFAALQLEPDPGKSPSRDEIEREAGALADLVTNPDLCAVFGLSVAAGASRPTIESIRILRRVGPDRQVLFGLVCQVLQTVTVDQGGVATPITGGSTIIMDSAGTIQFVIRKTADRPRRVADHLRFRDTPIGAAQRKAYEDRKTWACLCAGKAGH